jgi:Mg2+ and Co2+ transporter CorA
MKNDPDAKEDDLDKAYRKLQDAIDYKNDASNNELVIEDLVRSINKKYDDLVYYGNEINKYIDSIEDLEHFEGEFNPGFWNKYGNEIMNTITIIGIFATSPWS